jgi:glycosyltransferase involved in cell wall biosynthesis
VSPSGRFLWYEYWDGLPTKGDVYKGYGAVAPEGFPARMVRMIGSLDGIVAGCERARTNLRTIQGVRQPIRIVPPLTRLDSPHVEDRAYDADTQLNVVMVGRLGRGKGVEVLLVDIWPRLSIGPALLHLHGEFEDPDLKVRLESVAASHPSMRLHGGFERRKLAAILEGADLGLMLSIEEGYGLVTCEYMAAGLPFVMTDVGAAPEFTRANPDAILVAVDPSAIRDGITAMVARIRGGQTSRTRLARHYQATFSFDQIGAQHLASFAQPEQFWVGAP